MILDQNGRERLNNGVNLTERQQAKAMLLPATVGDCNEIAHAHAVKAMNHLGNQIPELVRRMVEEAVNAALLGYHRALQERGIVPPDASDGDTDSSQVPENAGKYPDPSDSGGDSD